MIKLITEMRPKKGINLSPLIREGRLAATEHAKGFVTSEMLIGLEEDQIIVLTISTWQSAEDLKQWRASELISKFSKRVRELLAETPKARIFEVAPTDYYAVH